MDLAYWGFTRWPFQMRRNIDFSPHGAAQEEAFARLLFLIDERRHYGVLAGASGTGKSGLLRLVKTYAQRQGRLCLEIDATGMSVTEFAQSIANETLGGGEIDAEPIHCWSRIQRQLVGLALVNQPIAVLIDNFDLASEQLAASVRRLVNLSVQSRAELTVLMSVRSMSQTWDLHDELDLSVELSRWSADETSQFISDSLAAAGAHKAIFSPDAVSAVHALSAGNPGLIVRLCDLALLAAMNDDQRDVDVPVVEAAVTELSPSRFSGGRPVTQIQRVAPPMPVS